ncbi:MAG: hypothetical protein QG670_2836 [Thermoproteota archaeon]|nr:hypothetical protein [Thermoproteota archaeon]
MKEQIVNCLNDKKKGEGNRKVLDFCKEPRTAAEIQHAPFKGDVFQMIVDLSVAEAIKFANGKYAATPLGLEILSSMQ